MGTLGLQTSHAKGYQSQFGLRLAQRIAVPISKAPQQQNAQAVSSNMGEANSLNAQPMSNLKLPAALQAQVQQVLNDFDLTAEDSMIFIADTSALNDSYPVVMVAETKPSASHQSYKAGICFETYDSHTDEPPLTTSAEISMDADSVLHKFYGIENMSNQVHTTKLLKAPQKGTIEVMQSDESKSLWYNYTPNPTTEPGEYEDEFVVEVTVGGYAVTLYYYVKTLFLAPNEGKYTDGQCGDNHIWKMSQWPSLEILATNILSTLTFTPP